MKIYTKQGDSGNTQVYAKEVIRVDKDDILLECYGTLDELNAWIGYCASCLSEHATLYEKFILQSKELVAIQQQLFAIGFGISDTDSTKSMKSTKAIELLESSIDEMQAVLPAQTRFILPGGHSVAAQVHIARTIARRAERCLVSVSKHHEVNALSLAYINRLSDYLFTLARMVNYLASTPDIEV